MSRATPLSLQSVDPDIRDAARDAAMREGMTLHQWLRRTIESYAADKGLNVESLDENEHMDAIARRLAREASVERPRLFTAAPAPRSVNRVDDILKDLASRLGEDRRAPAPKPQAQSTPWTQSTSQLRQAQQSALHEALQEALRTARREPEPAPKRDAAPIPPAPASAPLSPRHQAMAESAALRQQIDQLARNVANLPRRQQPEAAPTQPLFDRDVAADGQALRKLTAKTDEIRDLLANVVARPSQTNRIERQLDMLGARIDELASCAPTMSECSDLSRGLNDIRNLLTQGMNPNLLDALDRKIDQLSRRLEAMAGEPRDAHTQKFDDLARRIDNVHRRIEANITNAPKADMSGFERMLQELTRKLEQPAPKIELPTLDFSPVESEIRRLSNKIDAASQRPENPALESVRREFASLSARVDALSATVQSSSEIASKANAESIDALRKEIKGLSERVDRIAATAPEVSVLDGLQSQIKLLVDRIEALPRRETQGVHALEAQIVKLADKIDSIAAPSREESMLAQLQTEIARLSKRLGSEPAESARPAMAMLDQVQMHLQQLPQRQPAARTADGALDNSISDMVQQIQALREAAVEAVEASEAKAQAPARDPGPSEALQRELSDLRAQQENADRRTTQTLNAVHQTLERLVNRLSDLEEDMNEVRPEPVPAPAPAAPIRPEPKQEPRQEARKEPVLAPPPPPPKAQPSEVRAEPVEEPAQARQRRQGPGAVLSNQASFIAAARAASAASDETPAPARPSPMERLGDLINQIGARATEVRAEPVEPAPKAQEPKVDRRPKAPVEKPGALVAIRRALGARKRPLLIALAGLVVILGSLQAVQSLRESETRAAAAASAAPKAAQAPAIAPAAPAEPAEPAPATPSMALAAPEAPATQGFTPPLAANGFDASTTSEAPAAAPAAPTQGRRLAEAAANGQANAQYELGVRLAEGRGVGQDNQAARQWLEKAAAQNLAPAQYRLAAMLERGLGGAKDLKRAQELYGKAAVQGHARAMHNLGVLSAEGVEGKPDYAAAASWFRKAADFGLRDSQYNLAILYARGMGVDKNLPVSYAWFNAAAAQGDADSAQKRDEIAGRLTPTQLAAAKAMIEAYHARTPDPAVNEVAEPAGGWEALTMTSAPMTAPTPKPPARPAPPKAKVSSLNR